MFQWIHEIILAADITAWYYLNVLWHNAFLDAVIPYFRNQWTWAPLYLFLLIFSIQNFGLRGVIWCLFFLGTFGLADQLSAQVFKELFQRMRPCNDIHLSLIVHNIVPCGSGYSFPSSHASNHFALAVFSALTFKKIWKFVWWPALFWAIAVSYAQVYVGVHYPLDVFCGALLGTAAGIFTAHVFQQWFPLPPSINGEEFVHK